MKFVREEVPSPMKEDDDIIIVSSTFSRQRIRFSVTALEKKKAALGLGGDLDESMEHSITVDVEELERKPRIEREVGKEKGPVRLRNQGRLQKRTKGMVISEPKSSGKGDKFVIDDIVESGQEGDGQSLRLRAKGKLRVNDGRNRINNRRIAKNVDEVSMDGVDFCGEEHEARWKFVCARNILPERFLSEVTYNNQTHIDILQEGGLLGIMFDIRSHWPQLIREFISDLSEEITDPTSPMFHKVKLRGHVFKFSPILINKHYGLRDEGATGATLKLGDIIEELIGKVLTAWPTKGQLQASHMSLSLLITQHLNVLKKEDELGEDAKPLTISDKLMKGKHVLDVEFNEANQTEPKPEGEVAGMLFKVYEEELLRVEYEIQTKIVLASEMKAKIHALKLRVPPAVNASTDHPVPVATTTTNPPTADKTSTSHV
ncbi:hypothetical protein LIER_26130 [Lithospermum erythrorhizon]|uniref:Uncharacterized protein n=1 Tax=Lithospermum erythrorhizon TaxID=34254 RepID=A0AAV3RBA4_LITER